MADLEALDRKLDGVLALVAQVDKSAAVQVAALRGEIGTLAAQFGTHALSQSRWNDEAGKKIDAATTAAAGAATASEVNKTRIGMIGGVGGIAVSAFGWAIDLILRK